MSVLDLADLHYVEFLCLETFDIDHRGKVGVSVFTGMGKGSTVFGTKSILSQRKYFFNLVYLFRRPTAA